MRRHSRHARVFGGVLLFGAMLGGCVSLPPSVTTRIATGELATPTEFHATVDGPSEIVEGLLDLFDDRMLPVLVDRALDHNLDILIAAEQLAESRHLANAELGPLLPRVDGGVSVDRTGSSRAQTSSTLEPQLTVNWEVDIWGKLRDRKAAQEETAAAQAELLRAARDSIAAEVIQGWFDAVTAEQNVALEASRLENLEKIATNNRRNYQGGLASLDDLVAIERDIARTSAANAANAAARGVAARRLQLLLGSYPGGDIALSFELPALIAPPRAGLPADLLTNRPDLRAAWRQVVAADRSVKVAQKELYPSLKLTGAFGRRTEFVSGLATGATIWSLASSLTVPIFNAGELRNRARAAHSRAEQAWLRYLKVALRAFQEVEQALDQETLFAEREYRQQQAVDRAEDTARVFGDRYRNGLVSILEFLNAQNAVFDLRGDLLAIRNERLKNRVSLALALGKGV